MLDNPSPWPREIFSTEQVRAFDRYAIDELGIAGFELMQRAGQAALEFLQVQWPAVQSIHIYCGAGNNAGDGYVVAALASAAGLDAKVIAAVHPDKLTGDAAAAVGLARRAGVEIVDFASDPVPDDAGADVVVVDALLGSGIDRDVDGTMAAAVERLNGSGRPVFALDIPTGIDGDTGAVRGRAVKATATVTFVGLKAGLYLGEGPEYRGTLSFSGLGLPPEVYTGAVPVLHRLDASDPTELLRPRSRMAHKGLNGRVLVVGGAAGMAGAARLAAEAALRAGAGLVYAAVAPASVGIVMADRPEIMCRAVETRDEIEALAAAVDVVVIGPGLGRDTWGQRLADAILGIEQPLVVDADGLNYLAEHRQRRTRWVLTPHPAEAGRLLKCPTKAIQQDRRAAAARIASDYGAVTVLKGACSLVAEVTDNDQGTVSVCDYGNPGMATGGTGDVLAGLIGALIAQFGFSRAVVETGVLIHALAGDDAARDGERGLVATDLLPHIRHRVNPD
jgi:NAD(P)H-hydrate epimerase